jgi:hypothetical protein
VTLAPASLRGGLGRSAHKFTRLKDSSVLTALLWQLFLTNGCCTRRRQFRVRFEQFQWFAAPIPSRFLFCLLLGRRSLDSLRFPENGEDRRNKVSGKQYSTQARLVKELSILRVELPLEPGLHPSETPSDPINRIPLKTGSRRRADLVGPATARPHFGNLKIVGQMQQIGSMARLELTNLVVDPQ